MIVTTQGGTESCRSKALAPPDKTGTPQTESHECRSVLPSFHKVGGEWITPSLSLSLLLWLKMPPKHNEDATMSILLAAWNRKVFREHVSRVGHEGLPGLGIKGMSTRLRAGNQPLTCVRVASCMPQPPKLREQLHRRGLSSHFVGCAKGVCCRSAGVES